MRLQHLRKFVRQPFEDSVKDPQLLGVFSLLGTSIVLFCFAYALNGYAEALNDIRLFFSGRGEELVRLDKSILVAMGEILALITIDFCLMFVLGISTAWILAKSLSGHVFANYLEDMTEGYHFLRMVLWTVGEELYARVLFLKLLRQVSFLQGEWQLYLLVLLGNSTWSIAHLYHYRDRKDRNWWRTLPQFLSGLFFSIVFLRYGIEATLLAHLAATMVLFSVYRRQRINEIDAVIVLVRALIAAVSITLLEKPIIGALKTWLSFAPSFQVDGWRFIDYMLTGLFLGAVLGIVFDVLLYDREVLSEYEKRGGIFFFIGSLAHAPIAAVIVMAVNRLLTPLLPEIHQQGLLTAMLFSLVARTNSGSATARVFWTGTPQAFVALCIVQSVGPLYAFAYFLVASAVFVPVRMVRRLDD